MKNSKLISILMVATFALTGCKKTCSKEEFIDLANKTEEHQYRKASVKVKGKSSSTTEGVTQTYEPNDTFDFEFQGGKNGSWNYAGESPSSLDMKTSILASCIVVLSITVRDLVKQEEFSNDNGAGKLTCYSSPLGFNYVADYKDYEEDLGSAKLILNGKSNATYTFDSQYGVVTQYIEKGDIKMTLDYSEMKINTSSVTDLTLDITYSD